MSANLINSKWITCAKHIKVLKAWMDNRLRVSYKNYHGNDLTEDDINKVRFTPDSVRVVMLIINNLVNNYGDKMEHMLNNLDVCDVKIDHMSHISTISTYIINITHDDYNRSTHDEKFQMDLEGIITYPESIDDNVPYLTENEYIAEYTSRCIQVYLKSIIERVSIYLYYGAKRVNNCAIISHMTITHIEYDKKNVNKVVTAYRVLYKT